MVTELIQFVNMGIAGVILLWFMFRIERILTRFDKTVQLMARATLRLLERRDSEMATQLSKDLYRISGPEDED